MVVKPVIVSETIQLNYYYYYNYIYDARISTKPQMHEVAITDWASVFSVSDTKQQNSKSLDR